MTVDEAINRLQVMKGLLDASGLDGGSYPIAVCIPGPDGFSTGAVNVSSPPLNVDGIGPSVCIVAWR